MPLLPKLSLLLLAGGAALAESGGALPGTGRWNYPADIPAEQYRELREFYEREIEQAARNRRPFADPDAARREFRRMIGAVDVFLSPKPQTEALADFGPFSASLVSWAILRAGNEPPTAGSAGTLVREYGILLSPKSPGRHPAAVVLGDADRSAADIAGLTSRLSAGQQVARRLAASGFTVFAPFFTQRRAFSEPWTDDRSWLFRLAYQTGHHPLGSEVQQVSAALDFLSGLPGVDAGRLHVAGYGQGALPALYAGALDPRIGTTLVSGYFGGRERAWDEPEDRLVWNLLDKFGDAELAGLVEPRRLIVEGDHAGARSEFERARLAHGRLVREGEGLAALRQAAAAEVEAGADRAMDPDRIAQIANAQFSQWQARYRNAALETYASREDAWRADTSSLDAFGRWQEAKRREYFSVIGRYPDSTGPLDARTVQIYDEDAFTGYRLTVRVYDGVHAYGILLVPKGMKPGGRRPVVFTQHGLAGTPEHALGVKPDPAADAVYSRFGMRLARRGYIVFAPMISTQGSVERNGVTRRAHLVGQIPLGIEVKKFGRVLDWLETQPFADKDRFAFYGLSYGGYTALWAGPGEPRFKAVITSGHFNDWSVKTTDLTQGTSFLFYPTSFDMFNFDLLGRFSHAELAMLTAPRAFMIEVGDRDGVVVAPRRFPDAEMQRVMDLYQALGIPDRAGIARFHGPHKVDGTEAFAFLDRILHWTPR